MFTCQYRNRELLLERGEGGYPAEYLLSRIRGRRASLISDWETLIRSATFRESIPVSRYREFAGETVPAGLWRYLLEEYRWVYLQMEKSLRDIFRPFFLYSELRTLFFCLRFKAVGDNARIEEVLSCSLFSKPLKHAIVDSSTVEEALDKVEDFFLPLSYRFKGLRTAFAKNGFRGAEQHLMKAWLEYIMDSDLHPVVREFFRRLADSRNIIALYKHLRWELKEEPCFIKGGRISHRRFRSVLEKGDLFDVASLIRLTTGLTVEIPGSTAVENALYRGISLFLRRAARELSGAGLILEYLWRCSLEVMNLGILFHGKEMERDRVSAELIR